MFVIYMGTCMRGGERGWCLSMCTRGGKGGRHMLNAPMAQNGPPTHPLNRSTTSRQSGVPSGPRDAAGGVSPHRLAAWAAETGSHGAFVLLFLGGGSVLI